MDDLAMYLGYAVMIAGGLAISAGLSWTAFEMVANRIGWTKRIFELAFAEARRLRRGAA